MSTAHENKSTSILKVAMNLAGACIASGVIIAGIYSFTWPIAQQKNIEIRNNTMKSLVKEADEFKSISGKTDWFVASKNKNILAYIVPSESRGYGGAIKLLVAVSPQGKVLNFSILQHLETPGLGDNALKEPFHSQFIGKTLEHLKVVKDRNNKEDIQAISGATITSNGVTNGVKNAVMEVEDYLGNKVIKVSGVKKDIQAITSATINSK